MSVQIEIFEEKNRREAALFTAIVTIGLFCLMYFIHIFDGADIVKPDYGIEVNFGTSDIGSGDLQTFNQPNDLKEKIESAPPVAKKEVVETPAPAKAVTPKAEPVKIKEVEEKAITSKVESPVKIKEATKPTAKPAPEKAETAKPAPKPEPAKAVTPTPAPPKPDAGSLYSKPSSKTGGNGTVGTTNRPGGNNNGDGAKGEVGDKGDPGGKVDAPLYSGKPGGGGGGSGGTSGGAGLQLTGWTWNSRPVVNDDSDEVGQITFEIKVDDQGELISVRPVSFTVSQRVVNLYKKAIERTSFRPTSNGARPAISTGRVTIKINPRN